MPNFKTLSLVLNHCTEKKEANWKEQLLQSKYNDPHLFGVLPNSAHAKFTNKMSTYGQVMVRDGDIPAQVQVKDVNKKPKFSAASTSGLPEYLYTFKRYEKYLYTFKKRYFKRYLKGI